MVKLFCAIVGDGVPFPPTKINCEAIDLKLFLAKKGGAWLNGAGAAAVTLDGVIPVTRDENGNLQGFEQMDPSLWLNDAKYFGDFHPAGGQVHVLVVLPNMLRIGVNKRYTETISSYMKIADRLKNSEEVQSLSRHLANVIVEGEAPTPFIVLENSSGTGKTQMAFNLQARGECDVFYIVCGKPGDREQSVYSAYAERTVTFRDCVSTDLGTMEKKSRGNHDSLGAVGEIRGRTTLALYGFILAALRGNELYCGEAQRSDVQDELIRRKERGAKPFVFFLDEFPRAGSTKTHLDDKEQLERENCLRTMRNVFHSFDLAVVVSSTNGTARNLLATSDRSRDSGPCLWCMVVPSFPRVILNGYFGIPALVMEILKHSRPLFAQIALKHMQDNPYNDSRDLNTYLNAMAGTLASRFGALKKRTDEFKIGQLCLLLCTSYHVVDDKVNTIDGHFARLLEQSAFELHLDTDGGLWKDNNSWTCRCVMPSPKEDMLLHLTMTGGPFFRPFDQPLCTVISKIQPPFHYDNTEQRSNDGMRLEALTAAAIVLASHAGGFGGVAFPTFLRELLFELGVSERGEMMQLLQDVEIAGWGTRVVPFLSPPNEEWPEWLNDSSTRFGNLFRTSNEDRIDFRTTSNFISGECKDYSSAINLGVVKSILMRVPAKSAIHLVVTNTLQKQYFTAKSKPSWETFVREQSLQNVDIYRISKGSTLQEIKGMTNQKLKNRKANTDRQHSFCHLYSRR
ncbi:hypothetical protein PC129_g15131 [Phytophthora cactorum]|uniref:P-loop containing nucleoside triphosphate hydrolase n=1 Tax=Phytophthora cactorum TaxID=29920 RepID=A0A8T1HPK4_9STRA|nr:hypothetical protein PC119_g17114 [Phytophthora cactorum]KAG3213937.1 hypothetical protein PC129_g15131 [Phytophthora cactorum]